jgi:hypothetical protein
VPRRTLTIFPTLRGDFQKAFINFDQKEHSMFGWMKKKTTASKQLPAQQVSAKDAPRVLAQNGFKCYGYIIAGVEVAGIDKKDNGNVYEVYRSQNRATALSFLNAIPQGVLPERHYVIVETPQGNVGKDMLGVFDE